MILRYTNRVVYIQRLVGIRPRQVHCRSQRNFAIGHIFYLLHHSFAALFKFLVELRHQRFSALRIHIFESGAGVMRHAVGDYRHRGQHGNQKDEEQVASKAHRSAPCARQPHSSDPRLKYLFMLYTEAYPETAASKSLRSVRCLPSNTMLASRRWGIYWRKPPAGVIIPRLAILKCLAQYVSE